MESDLLRVLTDKAADDERPPHAAAPSASSTMGAGQPEIAPELPARGSRVFVVAGIVAAVVLAFDASLFLVHHDRAVRPAAAVAAAPAASDPMPHYMLVPLDAPPAVAPTPTPAPTPVVATAIPDAPRIAVKEHRHSHHHHASH